MKKDIRVYLEDILASIEKIETYTRGLSFEQFEQNTEHQDAVIRRLEILGEAVKRVPHDVRERHPHIPWKQIAGMRDVLIHEYADVSLPRVWKVITGELAPLKRTMQEMLKARNGDS